MTRRRILPVLATMGAAFGAACSPVTLLNATAPREEVATDLPYGPGPRHRLDVYVPTSPDPAPVVVFFYGGGWENGSRGMYRFLGASLAAAGLVCVIPDYRLWPEAGFPAFIEDGAAAIAWTRANAAAHGGDPERLFVMGHSAGAQIATLLSLDARWLEPVGMNPNRDLRGVVGLSGPYDFLPLRDPTLQAIFGPPDTWPESQPINFVGPDAPPAFLGTGGDDTTVLPRNTLRLAERLRAAGDSVEVEVYPGVGHAPLIGAFAGLLRSIAPVRRDVLRFIAERSST
ncbi:MAG: alpha/beta hydrolase [Rhodospirillales bacterium]|nr:alpha/beta hydrolase [Rhodospirillales bacterium]